MFDLGWAIFVELSLTWDQQINIEHFWMQLDSDAKCLTLAGQYLGNYVSYGTNRSILNTFGCYCIVMLLDWVRAIFGELSLPGTIKWREKLVYKNCDYMS